jgi:hypothetical protein
LEKRARYFNTKAVGFIRFLTVHSKPGGKEIKREVGRIKEAFRASLGYFLLDENVRDNS